MKRWGAVGTEALADKVKVIEGNGKGLGWVVAEDFCGEAADCDVSAADGVKEGGAGGELRAREM